MKKKKLFITINLNILLSTTKLNTLIKLFIFKTITKILQRS